MDTRTDPRVLPTRGVCTSLLRWTREEGSSRDTPRGLSRPRQADQALEERPDSVPIPATAATLRQGYSVRHPFLSRLGLPGGEDPSQALGRPRTGTLHRRETFAELNGAGAGDCPLASGSGESVSSALGISAPVLPHYCRATLRRQGATQVSSWLTAGSWEWAVRTAARVHVNKLREPDLPGRSPQGRLTGAHRNPRTREDHAVRELASERT